MNERVRDILFSFPTVFSPEKPPADAKWIRFWKGNDKRGKEWKSVVTAAEVEEKMYGDRHRRTI